MLSLMLALTVAVQPTQLRLQPGATATATVTVSAPATARLVLWCSTGELSAPIATGAGTFTAVYRAPPTTKPLRALIAAWDEASGEAARTSLALAARLAVPVETDAGAQVTLLVHGRRSTARANAAGLARVTAWVGPDERVATVIARDVAGNATTLEMALDVPRAASVFVAAPRELTPGATARVFAFAVGEGAPALTATGGTLEQSASRAGITTAILRAPIASAVKTTGRATNGAIDNAGDMILIAAANDATATQRVHVAAAANATSDLPLSDWELGASASGRYGGALGSFALAVELRRRVSPSHFALGLDVEARYAGGSVDGTSIALGGAAVRVAGEARFRLTPSTFAVVAVAVGGTFARERRVAAPGEISTPFDGGPAIGAGAALLKRLGPGWLTVAAGYSWAPLLGLSLTNGDGVALTLGYRAARWPRRRRRARRRPGRDDERPRARRHRPGPAA